MTVKLAHCLNKESTLKLVMKTYLVVCETENRILSEKSNITIAKHLAFKHSLRSHIVKIKGINNEELKFSWNGWKFICNKCGASFDDDAVWVTHMSKQDCIKK